MRGGGKCRVIYSAGGKLSFVQVAKNLNKVFGAGNLGTEEEAFGKFWDAFRGILWDPERLQAQKSVVCPAFSRPSPPIIGLRCSLKRRLEGCGHRILSRALCTVSVGTHCLRRYAIYLQVNFMNLLLRLPQNILDKAKEPLISQVGPASPHRTFLWLT